MLLKFRHLPKKAEVLNIWARGGLKFDAACQIEPESLHLNVLQLARNSISCQDGVLYRSKNLPEYIESSELYYVCYHFEGSYKLLILSIGQYYCGLTIKFFWRA